MAFQHEGIVEKLELVRGIANEIRYWPRLDGVLVFVSAARIIGVFDSDGSSLDATLPNPAQPVGVFAFPLAEPGSEPGALVFSFTPPATWNLAEDYSFEIEWTDQYGQVNHDLMMFDVVRVPLTCPVDDNRLQAEDPALPRHLRALEYGNARTFIASGWNRVLAKIRGLGFRPALITDRHVFAMPCVYAALALLYLTLSKAEGDTYSARSKAMEEAFDSAWKAIGRVRFLDPTDHRGVVGAADVRPKFRGP